MNERSTRASVSDSKSGGGKGLDPLRMMLTLSHEIGQELWDEEKQAEGRRYRTEVVQRLHVRACQVTTEIVTLLENGLADGAMARWRTLHEICVVIELIAANGEDLAERYLAHDAVEAKNTLDMYLRTYKELGYAPPSKTEVKAVGARYDAAISRFGPEFANEYGWAAQLLNNANPRFARLAEAAGQARMRSHYKLASQNVHAGVKGIVYKLGMLGEPPHVLAGASNAGLEEPGQNTAITLMRVTAQLYRKPRFDQLVVLKVMWELHSKAVKGFIAASRRLKWEHNHPQP